MIEHAALLVGIVDPDVHEEKDKVATVPPGRSKI